MISYIKDTLFGFFVMCVAFSYSIFMISQAAFGFYQENSSLLQMYSGVLCVIVLFYFFLIIKMFLLFTVLINSKIVFPVKINRVSAWKPYLRTPWLRSYQGRYTCSSLPDCEYERYRTLRISS